MNSPIQAAAPPELHRFRSAALVALLAAPAAVYFSILSRFVLNVPVGDDYFALFQFLDQWRHGTTGAWDSARLIFGQFYSHRIPFTNLAVLAQSALLGHCDLRLLAALAWVGWGLLAVSLVGTNWHARPDRLWLLPLVLLLMQPQGETNLLTATGSPGHAWTLLLAFWATRCAVDPAPRWQFAALLLAAGAALCTANGLLLFPVLTLAGISRGRWRNAALSLAAGVAAWAWYLWGYSTAAQPIDHTAFSPPQLLLNAIGLVGAVINCGTMPLALVAAAGAGLLLATLADGVVAWPAQRAEGGQAFRLFLVLSVAMIAYARIGWPVSYMFQDRYRPYGLLLAGLLYLGYFGRGRPGSSSWWSVGTAIALAASFSLLSYASSWPDLLFTHRWAEATAINFTFDRELPMPSAPEQAAEAGRILRRAVASGDLRLPQELTPAQREAVLHLPELPVGRTTPPWICRTSTDVSGYVLESGESGEPAEIPDWGVIFIEGRPLVLPVLGQRARLVEVVRQFRFMSTRYAFIFPAHVYRSGQYALYGLKRMNDGQIIPLWVSSVNCP